MATRLNFSIQYAGGRLWLSLYRRHFRSKWYIYFKVSRVILSMYPSNWGLVDPLLAKMAKCGKSKRDQNACRNLHRTVATFKRKLPVKTSYVSTHYRRSKRKTAKVRVQYPVLRFSDWAECIFSQGGHFLLGGKSLDYADEFSQQLDDFWKKFRAKDPEFGLYRDIPSSEWDKCIPLALHGDEGRGRQKQPVMVLSAQTILPIREGRSNMAGSSNLTSRFLIYPLMNLCGKKRLYISFVPKSISKAFPLHSACLHHHPSTIRPRYLVWSFGCLGSWPEQHDRWDFGGLA